MTPHGARHRTTIDGLSVMGDPWSFLILREALFGVRRFDEMLKNIGSARSILARRLTELVAGGVLSRRPSEAGPNRPEYRLTRVGVDTFQATVALVQWGDRWLAGKAGPPLLFRHKLCGKRLEGALRCADCGEIVALADIARLPMAPLGSPSPLLKRMRRASNSNDYLRGRKCSGARTIRILGNRWTLMILLEILAGASRFEDIRGRLAVARNILSNRLNSLVEERILVRRLYQSGPARHEYRLTARGADLLAACLLLKHWSDKWFAGAAPAMPVFVHVACGRPLAPEYACVACGEAINAFEVAHADGPGAGMSRPRGARPR